MEVLTKTEYNYIEANKAISQINDKLKESNTVLNNKLIQANIDFNLKLKSAEDLYKKLDDKYAALLKSSADETDMLNKEIHVLVKRIEVGENLNSKADIEYKAAIKSLTEEIDKLNNENQILANTINAAEDFISKSDKRQRQAVEEIRMLNNKLDFKNRLLDVRLKRIEELKKEVIQYGNEIDSLCETVNGLEVLLEEKREDFDSLNTILTNELSIKEKKIAELEVIIKPPVVNPIVPSADAAILNVIKENGGKITETKLLELGGVTFEEGGIVKLKDGGVLKKNFLSTNYSILNK